MSCNIDSRGRTVRLLSGLVFAAIGVFFVVRAFTASDGAVGLWAAGAALGLAGAFQIYEGWAGWCALRAMGVKTPL